MSRQSDISALLDRANQQLKSIATEYESSLHKQTIAAPLRVDIKNLFENLRSVLDYLAHDIRDEYCTPTKPSDRIYFPILPDASQFSARVSHWFPGLKSAAPEIWLELERSQPYQAGNAWLSHFNKINNENKHGALVAQTRQEVASRIDAKITAGGAVSWDPKSVRFGSGAFIGGVPVNPRTQMPVPDPRLSIVKTIWFDFFFDGIEVSALALLRDSVNGINAIRNGLAPYL